MKMDIKEYEPILNLDPDIWIWREKILYYKNNKLFPILEIHSDGSILLYIDYLNINKFSKILKILIKSPFKFYLVTNQLNDPKVKTGDWINLSIQAYFHSLLLARFYKFYQELNWDVTRNLIEFAIKYGGVELIWVGYKKVLPSVDQKNYDYITGEMTYAISEEIRDSFKTLQRDIQIQLLFNE